MICKSCGRANELGARFCKSCGAPLESNESMQQNNTNQSENVCQQNNQYVMPESMYSGTTRMTKKEFNECANIKSITKNITAAAIIVTEHPAFFIILFCSVSAVHALQCCIASALQ